MNLEYLKEQRSFKKLTQKQVAEMIGLDYGSYRKVEVGIKSVSIKTLIKLANALELDTNKLLNIKHH